MFCFKAAPVGVLTMAVNLRNMAIKYPEWGLPPPPFRHVETRAGAIAVVRVSTCHHQGFFLFKLTGDN